MKRIKGPIYEWCKLKKLKVVECRQGVKISKSYYNETKDLFKIHIKDDKVVTQYSNGIVETNSIDEFVSYLNEKIKNIKLGRQLYSSNRPKKKMSYVRMKLVEYGLDYVKSKSGVNFNKKL